MTGPAPMRSCLRLAAELQTLRGRVGLSLVALAAKTPYSKSTWARYLSGKTLPPWAAVRDLAALAAEPEARLRALWLLAEEEWSGRGVVDAGPVRLVAPGKAAVAGSAVGPAAGTVSDVVSDVVSDIASDAVSGVRPGHASGSGSGTGTETRTGSAERTAAAAADRTPGGESAAASEQDGTTTPDTGRSATLPRGRRWWRRRLPTPVLAGVGVVALCVAAFGIGSAFHDAGRPYLGGGIWAPPGCAALACNGKDPQAMNCGVDPLSLDYDTTTDDATVEIRYKQQCSAAWTRVQHTHVGDKFSITDADGHTQTTEVTDPYTAMSYDFTKMVPALRRGEVLRACLIRPVGQPECVTAKVP